MSEHEFLQSIRRLCREHGASRAVLFGSRARGTNTPRSDFDIAVYGMPSTRVLEEAIDELPTLYSVDVVNMETCANPHLIREIEDHGILL